MGRITVVIACVVVVMVTLVVALHAKPGVDIGRRSQTASGGQIAGAQSSVPSPPTQTPEEDDRLWSLLQRGGCVVILRHAETDPTQSDRATVDLADRTTQRNLSDAGRAQAKKIGAAFHDHGVPIDTVLSSPYFRCSETAQLAFAKFATSPALASIPEAKQEQVQPLADFRALLVAPRAHSNTVLVTHGANIEAALNLQIKMGHWLVLTPSNNGGVEVAGELSVR